MRGRGRWIIMPASTQGSCQRVVICVAYPIAAKLPKYPIVIICKISLEAFLQHARNRVNYSYIKPLIR
jgi:hypothetical protein